MRELRNLSRGTVLADRLEEAVRLGSRLRGLLGRVRLEQGQALLIRPCSSVHTFFLRFPIDVLFLDRKGIVLAAFGELQPFRATRPRFRARCAIELPAGTVRRTGTRPGDRMALMDGGRAG